MKTHTPKIYDFDTNTEYYRNFLRFFTPLSFAVHRDFEENLDWDYFFRLVYGCLPYEFLEIKEINGKIELILNLVALDGGKTSFLRLTDLQIFKFSENFIQQQISETYNIYENTKYGVFEGVLKDDDSIFLTESKLKSNVIPYFKDYLALYPENVDKSKIWTRLHMLYSHKERVRQYSEILNKKKNSQIIKKRILINNLKFYAL